MKYVVAGQVPGHRYVWVDSAFTHQHPVGFIPAVWFGLVSMHGRAWGCSVLLESGAVYRNLPPHALGFRHDPEPVWTVQDAQMWDCYGEEFSTLEYAYLSGLSVLVRTRTGKRLEGEYLFTAVPIGDGFSRAPDQAKEFFFIALDNGRLTIQPTDRVVFREESFTEGFEFPEGLRRQREIHNCEE